MNENNFKVVVLGEGMIYKGQEEWVKHQFH